MRCDCGSTTDVRILDVPETWGIHYICKKCDDYWDAYFAEQDRFTSAHQDVTPSVPVTLLGEEQVGGSTS